MNPTRRPSPKPRATTQRRCGTIVEWNETRGFGFATYEGGQRVFVHAKAFLVRERPPAVGDAIVFSLGADDQGRPRAERVEPLYPNARILGRQFVAWIALLVVPVLALRRLTLLIDAWLLFGAAGALSVLTYLLYWIDKRRAQAGAWRTPESTLHFFELIGGWPGAFLAQRHLRHKIRKVRYQVVFWFIVVAHQLVALDSLLGWRMVHAIEALIAEH